MLLVRLPLASRSSSVCGATIVVLLLIPEGGIDESLVLLPSGRLVYCQVLFLPSKTTSLPGTAVILPVPSVVAVTRSNCDGRFPAPSRSSKVVPGLILLAASGGS